MTLLAFPLVSAIAQVPKRGTAPSVAAVNDCPDLAFHDDFIRTSFNMWPGGPIPAPPPVMWNPWGKVDGSTWWTPNLSASAYSIANGYISLRTMNSNGSWLATGIGSAAYNNNGAVKGKPTGFLAAPPCYWEVAVWLPQLSASDAANTSGLWPSVSFYSDPSVTTENIEYDLFECYSVNYTIVHTNWHNYKANTSGGKGTITSDISQGWHIFGMWIDTTTTHWYLDGQEIFNAPTEGGAPLYIVIANALGGGWPINLSTSQHLASRELQYRMRNRRVESSNSNHVRACQSHQNEYLATPGRLKCRFRASLWTALACSNDNHLPGVPSPQGPLLSLGN